MTIEKWQKFEASFEGNPNIEFYLEARQGSKPYIEIPPPPGHTFAPGEFSHWAFMILQQLVSVTGATMNETEIWCPSTYVGLHLFNSAAEDPLTRCPCSRRTPASPWKA